MAIISICQQCGREFKHKPSKHPKYCSKACADKAQRKPVYLECSQCGKVFTSCPSKARGERHFCCGDCKNVWLSKNNPKNHGGYKRPDLSEFNRTKNPMNKYGIKGYRIYRECKEDTYKKIGSRHEHRIVAEEKIGRALLPNEVVHHIDGNKHNNNPDNLMVLTQAEHIRIHLNQGGGCLCQK